MNHREPSVDFNYPGDDEEAEEEPPPADSTVGFNQREAELRIMERALKFVHDIKADQAADLRLDVALLLVSGRPTTPQIARRHKVSERRVRQARSQTAPWPVALLNFLLDVK